MLTKAIISKNISKKIKISHNDSQIFLDQFLFLIKSNSKNKKIKISNFGIFSYQQTPERIGRNPKTKESYIINTFHKLVFKAAKNVKEILN